MTATAKAPGTPLADDATLRVMDGLRRVIRALSSSARSGPRDGLSGAQIFVLRQIAAAPGLALGELAARTLSRQSTVSEVVAKLAARGFVRRATGVSDARQTTLSLTAKGQQAVAKKAATAPERLAKALAELPAGQRAMLAAGFDAWLAAAGLTDTPATMFFEDGPAPRGRKVARPPASR